MIIKTIGNAFFGAFLASSSGLFKAGNPSLMVTAEHVYDLTTIEDFPNDDDYYIDTYYGSAVAMSSDGRWVIVGAKGVDEECWPIEECPGRVFIYEWKNTAWVEHVILIPFDALDENEFGASVAIDGQYAMVGAPYHNDLAGSIYVFRLLPDGSDWEFFHKISGEAGEFLGPSIALDGDTAIIGASEHDNRRGRAYIYNITTTPATKIAELAPADRKEEDRFGDSVDINGHFAIVGSPLHDLNNVTDIGSAYIYRKTDDGWVQDTKIFPWDDKGAANDNFGTSVAINADVAIAGAPADSSTAVINFGSAFVFRRIDDVWTPETQLYDTEEGKSVDLFGKSVGVYGNRIFIGAPGKEFIYQSGGPGGDFEVTNAGQGYLFVEEGSDWILEDKVESTDLKFYRAVGTSIALGKHGFVIGGIDGIAYVGRFKEEMTEEEEYRNDDETNDDGNGAGHRTVLEYNNATLVANSNSYFTFSCTNSDPDLLVYAAIIANTHCTGEISSLEINPDTPTARLVSEIVADSSIATLTRNFQDELNLANVNQGFDSLEYCIRCDIYHKDHPEFSIMARKFDLSLDITFETSSTFNVDSILTKEFIADDVDASDTRSVSIEVFKGDCDSNPTCNVLEDDCFSGANSVAIGETLELCIKASDSDVLIKGLERATAAAGAFVSPIVRSDTAGEVGSTNFVTKSVINAAGEVTLSTLLIPAYYDALKNSADDFISVSGVALLEYVSIPRRLSREGIDRSLQVTRSDMSPFAVSVPLENSDAPMVARSNTNSSTRFADAYIVTAGLVILGNTLFNLI